MFWIGGQTMGGSKRMRALSCRHFWSTMRLQHPLSWSRSSVFSLLIMIQYSYVAMMKVGATASFIPLRHATFTSSVTRLTAQRAFTRGRLRLLGNANLNSRKERAGAADISSVADGKSHEESVTASSLSMENIYQQWTLEDDEELWDAYQSGITSTVDLAARLGRGLKGVRSRLLKLQDVQSSAYQRLFSKSGRKTMDLNDSRTKLVPVSEVLRRIQWDYQLSSRASDFVIHHYDRIDDDVCRTPLDAPNNSISGGTKNFVDALPEHRIIAVAYKERVVWDRERKIDLIFGSGVSSGAHEDGQDGRRGSIYEVIDNYDEWKHQRDAVKEWNKKRQAMVSGRIADILGPERFGLLKQWSSEMMREATSDALPSTIANPKKKSSDQDLTASDDAIKYYVQDALGLFRQARNECSDDKNGLNIPEDVDEIEEPAELQSPRSDADALECLSELVALLPDTNLRLRILDEISEVESVEKKGAASVQQKKNGQYQLPKLNEDDLTETYVRGSGPGGQKVNKTSNRVILVHEPTGLRVECQETRSLTQNRKIARRRLQLKLDDFLNGNRSKANRKAQAVSDKKKKAKARARKRLKQKSQIDEED